MKTIDLRTKTIPLTTDVLGYMQEAMQQVELLTALIGNTCVLTGCSISNGIVGSGYLVHENEIYYCPGGEPKQFVQFSKTPHTITIQGVSYTEQWAIAEFNDANGVDWYTISQSSVLTLSDIKGILYSLESNLSYLQNSVVFAEEGKGLSESNYTGTEKLKLSQCQTYTNGTVPIMADNNQIGMCKWAKTGSIVVVSVQFDAGYNGSLSWGMPQAARPMYDLEYRHAPDAWSANVVIDSDTGQTELTFTEVQETKAFCFTYLTA
jgi:hypothetical protein